MNIDEKMFLKETKKTLKKCEVDSAGGIVSYRSASLPTTNNSLQTPLSVGDQLVIAFVQGVKWWEFKKTEFTLFQSDRNLAEEEAIRLLELDKLGRMKAD